MPGLRELHPAELLEELERVALPTLTDLLRSRTAGHCMKVSDLDAGLMALLCGRLRAEVPEATVVVLSDGRVEVPEELAVTSTKLVELRNPLPDGSLRPPLLVFVPNDVRASAEDSFGVATFEEVSLDRLYEDLRARLLNDLPNGLRAAVTEALRRLEGSERTWPFADAASVVRFLLTGKVNGNDPEAIGAALYEIGLVPDFELLSHPERAPQRLARNRDCVERLTWSPRSERGRVGELELQDKAFRKLLGDFLAEAGAEDPRSWTRRVVLDRNFWKLSFDKWKFEDGGEAPDAIHIADVEVDLPAVGEDAAGARADQLIGQKVLRLGPGGQRNFRVTFRVNPVPSRVQGLAKFVVQVVSKEGGPVGLARRKSAWAGASNRASVTFTSLSRVEWEEGWHYVRVLAETEGGDLIPLSDAAGHPVPWGAEAELAGTRPNESDLFYVLPEGDVDVTPTQRAVPREYSAAHAVLRARFAAASEEREPLEVGITDVRWSERPTRARAAASEVLEVRLGGEGLVHVPVSHILKELEQKILSAPAGPLTWHLPVNLGVPSQATGGGAVWPSGETAERFLESRCRYFEAVLAGDREMISQAAEPAAHSELVGQYASDYLTLVVELSRRVEARQKADSGRSLAELRRLLAVDSVSLAVTDHQGGWREATLVAPTHPLRALWFAAWGHLGTLWARAAKEGPGEYVAPARDALLRSLAPMNFPPVLSTEGGSILTAVDNINPFWTLFAPPSEGDPRGLIGEVCSALGLPEPGIGGALIDGRYLASRVRRYLVQHPYVRTLTINAFNAGRGAALADTLLELQKDLAFSDLRYDIRLFVPDPNAPGAGEALAALLSPEGAVTAREADAFSTLSASHLHPKLRVAVRSLRDFRAAPAEHAAHLSMLFDVFPAEEVAARRATPGQAGASVHGLVQEFSVEYHEDESTVAWRRQPRHGRAAPLAGAEELSDLLGTLSAALSGATAAVATGEGGLDLRPVIGLALSPEDRALLHQVHEVSDWVFTVDRNLGIEFFDHGGRSDRPDYLIDHSPDAAYAIGHRLAITSRSVAELESFLRPVLEQFGLDAEGGRAVVLLDQLRSLSGRLALKLISSPSQRAEALGLALSRLYLQHQGVFGTQVVVPLDAHLDLYRAPRGQQDELGDEVSFRRTDLALFDLDAARRIITCRLVEVKCYASVGDLSAYNTLKGEIAEQIAVSEQVLAYHFDPRRTVVDRPDRTFKTHELATLLEFYLDRAERYGVIDATAAEEARYFIRSLGDGYGLSFTRSALIFDFEKPGTEVPELEAGIEYHRIGSDLIRELIEAVPPSAESDSSDSSSSSNGGRRSAPSEATQVGQLRAHVPSVPVLEGAAFQAPRRDRTVSWDDLSLAPAEPLATPAPPAAAAAEPPPTLEERHEKTDDVVAESTPSPAAVQQEPAAVSAVGAESPPPIGYDVMLGTTVESRQYGILGEVAGRRVAVDLDQTHTISLFGVQGGGKSYTLGSVAEMATLPIPNVNVLPRPLATVIFHYSPTMDYRPEFTSMVSPNSDEAQVRQLREVYGAEARALGDVLLLTPADKLGERTREYPEIEVRPLKFAAAELQASHWRFLMGAVGNQAAYIRQLGRVMKSLRNDLTVDALRAGIEQSQLPDHLKELAKMRLDFAAEYIDDTIRLGELIRPGRLIIVDLRDEFIEKDQALGLFVVLLQLFADAKYEGRAFNKLVVFDEAHKYIESSDLIAGLIEVVREMRHKGTSIMVASQDPPSVPLSLIELSSQIILHRFNSPAWLKYIQKANAALGSLTPERMAGLRPGEAYIWSSKATDEAFTQGAVKIRCRPRVTLHGGDTRTATGRE